MLENKSAPIQLSSAQTPPAAAAPPAPEVKPAPPHHKSSFRESMETIVFVVFLVLLLKAFVAEAFVIPTGSMATTLLGYHREGRCEMCGYSFSVNASEEAEAVPRHRPGDKVEAACPNCRHRMEIPVENLTGGDKVLVSKPEYDLTSPKRFDVIVFKFPGTTEPVRDRDEQKKEKPYHREGPQKDFSAHNYIKRLMGLPGEKLSIWHGDIYVRTAGKREIIRKPPDVMLDVRRNVYNNDYQAKDLVGVVPPRWESESPDWKTEQDGSVFQSQAGKQTASLRYHHRIWPSKTRPADIRNKTELEELKRIARQSQLITDFLDYNVQPRPDEPLINWVRDLMIDFEVAVAKPEGELRVELASGFDTHQAIFDLAAGQCTLRVIRDGKELIRETASVVLTGGSRKIRFSDFDDRLTLWVDGKRPFGDGIPFESLRPNMRGPTTADLNPAIIGVRNAAVTVRHLQLWRDLYYTRGVGHPAEVFFPNVDRTLPSKVAELLSLSEEERRTLARDRGRPAKWNPYYEHDPADYDVPDGCYFALGDNSTHSRDSRDWGHVPERLLLGKAVFVYWPLHRFGMIR